jgi:hypothetical protein
VSRRRVFSDGRRIRPGQRDVAKTE